jgi:hypothetical protein
LTIDAVNVIMVPEHTLTIGIFELIVIPVLLFGLIMMVPLALVDVQGPTQLIVNVKLPVTEGKPLIVMVFPE